jgi:PAS domain S-box-containing protein
MARREGDPHLVIVVDLPRVHDIREEVRDRTLVPRDLQLHDRLPGLVPFEIGFHDDGPVVVEPPRARRPSDLGPVHPHDGALRVRTDVQPSLHAGKRRRGEREEEEHAHRPIVAFSLPFCPSEAIGWTHCARRFRLRAILQERPEPLDGQRWIGSVLARCLEDLERRDDEGAPLDRALEALSGLLPALDAGDADAARAAVLASDLPARELLDLVLRAHAQVRRRRARPPERAARERAAEAALRALADRPEPRLDEDADRRRQLAALYRRLLGLLPDGLLSARPDGRLVHANAAARDALGVALRDLPRASLQALFADRRVAEEVLEEVRREGLVRAREADLRGREGRTLPVRIAAARVDGPDPRVLLLFRDLTEIRHIRSRLLETEKLGAMAKIAGSVAHEIRNPLNALFLNADLLEDELTEAKGLTPPIEQILGVMREEIERLNEIIKNYLSLSKLGNANFEVLDLNHVVQEFFDELEESAANRPVRLELRLCRKDVTIRADRNMVRRVLVNLAQNALDATPTGGRIVFGTRRLTHRAKLWVRDNGAGIAPDVRGQLFQPFFSTKERGTGLGLYLIREIVIAHDGQVSLAPAEPQGTVATVILPLLGRGKGDRG